jgi:radical SAM protein with 4Fe4S-binding SPASM domain
MFISHLGEIFPAGFLPLSAGSVRQINPVEIYRNSPLFVSLRQADQFQGRCGKCEYRKLCGGSRARAFAYTGNPLESDPLCPYLPKDLEVRAS